MSQLLNITLTQALRALGRFSYRLDSAWRRRLGGVIGKTAERLSSSRRAVTLGNIARAFPDEARSWHEDVCSASYKNLGIVLAELLTFPHLTPWEARQMVEFQNLHLIEDEYQHKRGLVLLSGHYGNWELLAFALPLFVDLPISVVVTAQTNYYAEDYLSWYRSRTGNRLIRMDNAAKHIITTLRQGEAIAMLADQAATPEKDIFVPFFGQLACTYEAPAVLTLRYNTPMIVGFAERMDDGRYVVNLQKIPHEDLEFTKESVRELTCRHVHALEQAIRKRPEQWAWQHKRWKHDARLYQRQR